MTDPLLEVRDLGIEVREGERWRPLLSGVSFRLRPAEVLALTGASGAGKTLLARCLLGLAPAAVRWSGEILWRGRPLHEPGDWRGVRGPGMTLILQEPRTALNPVLSVQAQLAETLRLHGSSGDVHGRALALLEEVRIPDPRAVLRAYAHQLSGGMRQRVLLACSLACRPRLLVADEITSALDADTRGAIMDLVEEIRLRRGMALLMITHDLDLVRDHGYRLVEVRDGILAAGGVEPAAPPAPASRPVPDAAAVLEARGVVVRYRGPGGRALEAVRGVDLDLRAGERVGLAGASGCGKSSLALALARHLEPAAGSVRLLGRDFLELEGAALRSFRRRIQLLFQDPGESLNPRQTVAACLREAAGPADRTGPAARLAEVGLGPEFLDRHPHRMSGGQRQRVALARCLAADPAVLVADEPTTQLDPRTERRIMDLLAGICAERELGLLMISHDMGLLEQWCSRMAVMLGGLVVEAYPTGDRPRHPYTRMLRESSAPSLGSPRPVPGPDQGGDPGKCCPFAAACHLATDACRTRMPVLRDLGNGHLLRCPEAD